MSIQLRRVVDSLNSETNQLAWHNNQFTATRRTKGKAAAKSEITALKKLYEGIENDIKKYGINELVALKKALNNENSRLRGRAFGFFAWIRALFVGMRQRQDARTIIFHLDRINRLISQKGDKVLEHTLDSTGTRRLNAFIKETLYDVVRTSKVKASEFTYNHQFFIRQTICSTFFVSKDPQTGSVQQKVIKSPAQLLSCYRGLVESYHLKEALESYADKAVAGIDVFFSDDISPRVNNPADRNKLFVKSNGQVQLLSETNDVLTRYLDLRQSKEELAAHLEALAIESKLQAGLKARQITFNTIQTEFRELGIHQNILFSNHPFQGSVADFANLFISANQYDATSEFEVFNKTLIIPVMHYTQIAAVSVDPLSGKLTSKILELDIDRLHDELGHECDAQQAERSLCVTSAVDAIVGQYQGHILQTDELPPGKKFGIHYASDARNLGCHLHLEAPCISTLKLRVPGFSVETIKEAKAQMEALREKYVALENYLATQGTTIKFEPVLDGTQPNFKGTKEDFILRPSPDYKDLILYSCDIDNRNEVFSVKALDFENIPDKLKTLREARNEQQNYKRPQHLLERISPLSARALDPLPNVDYNDLLTMFDQINFTNSSGPNYYNPNYLLNDGKLTTPAQTRKHLLEFLRCMKEEARHSGVPDDSSERKKYYHNLKALITHNLVAMRSLNDPGTTRDFVIALAHAGKYCGGRWKGEALQQYALLHQHIALPDNATLEDVFLRWMDEWKTNIVAGMAQKPTNTGVHPHWPHLQLNYLKLLGQSNIAHFPTEDATYKDPYGFLSHDDYKTDDKIIAEFRRLSTVRAQITAIEDSFREALKKEKQNVRVRYGQQALDVLRDGIEEHVIKHDPNFKDKKEAIQKLANDYGRQQNIINRSDKTNLIGGILDRLKKAYEARKGSDSVPEAAKAVLLSQYNRSVAEETAKLNNMSKEQIRDEELKLVGEKFKRDKEEILDRVIQAGNYYTQDPETDEITSFSRPAIRIMLLQLNMLQAIRT